MKHRRYLELKEPHLSKLENRYDCLPEELKIDDISYSLNKQALKNTLRRQKLRKKLMQEELEADQ